MIYVIIPFGKSEALRQRIGELGIDVCDAEAPAAYFVSYDQTTSRLSEAIGYGDDGSVGSGVVIPVSNYSGYASADLWEWLEIHENGR